MSIKAILKKCSQILTDKQYIRLKYFRRFHKFPDLKNPKTFNEKLQWLKLYDRKPIYTTMVDKYEVKKYVTDIIGEDYIIPTLGVWDSFEDIDFNISSITESTSSCFSLYIDNKMQESNNPSIK